MKPEQFSSATYPSGETSLMRWVCVLGSAGILGGGAAMLAMPARANADIESAAPAVEAPVVEAPVVEAPPVPVESVPAIAPVQTSAESLLTPHVTTNPVVEASPAAPQSSSHGSAAEDVPHVTASPTVELVPRNTEPSGEIFAPADGYADAPQGTDGVFIDPTDYSLGATRSSDGPAVVFSNRSTGCEFTVGLGQTVPNQSCNAAPGIPVGPGATPGNMAVAASAQGSGGGGGGGFSVGPVSIGGNGITVGGTTVISREYFNEAVRPLNLLRRGAQEFVFPLAVPAPITSLFGWRSHPIFGERRFHSGTDLGAPAGTPVLAVKDGAVETAGYLGGYGYTVILNHEEGTQETRYAHLARILVEPGETVKQGEVVGLVGSTGNSTGPHLHFELRELTAQGWMLVDADELMNHTVTGLVDLLNSPLQALGLAARDEAKEEGDANDPAKTIPLPYRPAQPNAS